jgi:hypothetical protein
MPQPDFDTFKLRLQEWKETHSEEYDLFVEDMNSRDTIGYQKIMSLAISLVPAYQKLINQKANQGTFDDISDIETLFTENKLAQTLINEFEKSDKNSIIPAMLYWLYSSQSFERMVEKGEELRRTPHISYVNKFVIKSTIDFLRNKSIKLGLRTKADWEEHHRLMKEVDNSDILDLRIDGKTKTSLAKPKDNKELTLEDMIMLDDEKKKILLTKIGDYIRQGIKGQKIAWMILALRELGYLPISTSDRHLFEAIRQKFGHEIGSDKGIYNYLDKTAQKYDNPEIETLINYFELN